MGNVHAGSFVGGMVLGTVLWLILYHIIVPLIINGSIDWNLVACKLRTWDYECETQAVEPTDPLTPTTEDVIQRILDGYIDSGKEDGSMQCGEAEVALRAALRPLFKSIVGNLQEREDYYSAQDLMDQLDASEADPEQDTPILAALESNQDEIKTINAETLAGVTCS